MEKDYVVIARRPSFGPTWRSKQSNERPFVDRFRLPRRPKKTTGLLAMTNKDKIHPRLSAFINVAYNT
ncbi:MAG TPA: hypothetical protein VJ873_13365, partial [bacterium]|nr:hypothetical protein [bacterium]